MKYTHFIPKKAILLIGVAIATMACSKDKSDTLPDTKAAVTDPVLLEVLKAQGLTFEGNTLVIDDKARAITSLDLSGKKIKSVSGLEALPNLAEVNLANNSFPAVFDFAQLPPSVRKVDLSGNTIYQYKNLAVFDLDGGQYRLLRDFDHLTLPASAKYNMEEVVAFAKTTKGDLQMQSASGKAEKYTTLRPVPDAVLLKYLKKNFSSLLNGEQIDISKKISLEDAYTNISIGGYFYDPAGTEINTNEIKDFNGLEYLINHPQLAGNISIEKEITVPYLKISKEVGVLMLNGVNTPILDLSKAENIHGLIVINNKEIKTIDLSASKILFNQSKRGLDAFSMNALIVANCPELDFLNLPNNLKNEEPHCTYAIHLLKLPKLGGTIDLSMVQTLADLEIGALSANVKIVYPTMKYFVRDGVIETEKDPGELQFVITEDLYKLSETQDFIKKHFKKLRTDSSFSNASDLKPYDYTKNN